MKFTTAAALLLPAATWASPIIEARQPAERAKFITNSLQLEGNGCLGAGVSFDASNEIATVSLPNYAVQVPGGNTRERSCNVALKVHFPLGCTNGTARTILSGQDALSVGITGTYGHSYAVSPVTGSVTEFSPDLTFTGAEVSTQVWSSDRDFITYTQRPTTPQNQDVTFRLLGNIQLQESGNLPGRLSNDRYVLDISNQGRCCKCF